MIDGPSSVAYHPTTAWRGTLDDGLPTDAGIRDGARADGAD